jgi:putative redox protein
MKITIQHTPETENNMIFEAQTKNNSFKIIPKEISPVELFLSGIIACSATDMVMLPKKSGFEAQNLSIEGEVARNDVAPKKFNEIHLIYKFDSEADELTARRWVLSTIETYCSTINTVRGVSKILFSIIYNGKKIANRDEVMSGDSAFGVATNGENAPEIGGACES